MKTILRVLLLCVVTLPAFGQTSNPKYDSTLAKRLGGDDYGMKKYVLVLLKTGTNTTTDKKFTDSMFAGHMGNIGKLVDLGKLVLAGPLGKNDKTYRGIFVLNAASIDEAKDLLKSDPAINAKLLDAELYIWYSSAAISEYLPSHEKIWRLKP